MTPPPPPPPEPPPPAPKPPAAGKRSGFASRFRLATIWSAGQFVIALALTLAVLAYLLLVPMSKSEPQAENASARAEEPVRVAAPGLIRVEAGTPLAEKLQVVELHPTQINAPVLTVTGSVAASLRPGAVNGVVPTPAFLAIMGTQFAGRSSDYWQFNAPEVLTTFTDWQRAKADITFARMQLIRIREAAIARTFAQQELVDTMGSLVTAGTETKKQLAIERATLRQFQIQQEREIYEAETAIRMAERSESANSRQLQQAGLDPALLGSLNSGVDLVMAEVPEAFLNRVKVGQECKAEFFGLPNQSFDGRVNSIAPVITKDRRSLRVLFTVTDQTDQLRPGMFAEIGLGTNARDALLAPAEGVIHVGRSDYLLVATPEAGLWRVTPVEVGEMREGRVEILNWKPGAAQPPGAVPLKPGDRVLGQGAILLKPAIVKALQSGNGGGP